MKFCHSCGRKGRNERAADHRQIQDSQVKSFKVRNILHHQKAMQDFLFVTDSLREILCADSRFWGVCTAELPNGLHLL